MSLIASAIASVMLFIQGLFGFAGGGAIPDASPIMHTQPAAAAGALSDAQLDFLATTTPEASTPPTTTTASDAPQTTIIQQPVIERIVERTVPAPAAPGISEQTLAGRLASLKDDLLLRIAAVASAPIVFSGPAPTTPVSTATFAPAQRIDSLTNTAINTPTITGGSISGATVSGTLSGTFSGTISGATSFTEATTTSFAISSIPWGLLSTDGLGNVVATSTPTALNFIATSATATSTFAGGLDVGGVISTNGEALVIASTTLGNYFFGHAGNLTTTGPLNTGIGYSSLNANTTGTYNSAFGTAALLTNTTGSQNSALGANALAANTTGTGNIAIGVYALGQNKSATNTVAIGFQAAIGAVPYANKGGTYVGAAAGGLASNGSDFNTFIGYQAGINNTTGSNNIWVGTATSSTGIANLTTGSQNILIGNNISLPSATASGQLNIGNIIYGTGITGTGSTISTGNIGIGTTSPTNKLEVAGNAFLGGTITGTSTLALTGTTGTTTIAAGQGFTIGGSQFVVQQGSGNVGIGTAIPVDKLSILKSVGNDTPAAGVILSRYQASASDMRAAGIFNYFDSSAGKEVLAFSLSQATTPNTIANTKMVIRHDGNVGIGTTSPFRKFEVAGSSGESSGGPIMALYATNGFTNARRFSIQNGVDATSNYLGFNVENDAGAVASTPLTIRTSGNVGIGTTTPWGKLSITGTGTGTGLGLVFADSANTPRFVIQDNGNVGIGTTAPGGKLDVAGPTFLGEIASGNNGRTYVDNNGGARFLQYDNSGAIATFFHSNGNNYINGGNVGIGTTTPWGKLSITGSGTGTGLAFAVADSANTPRFIIQDNGNVGIGTTSPTAQLSTTGTVRFSNFGAGTLTTDASGNLSVSSDERLKNIDGEFTRGLADVVKLSPIQYHWNTTSGLDTSTQYAGFSAQNVQQAVPEAVGSSTNGYLTLQDRPLIATVVNAIKDLAQQVSDLAERVVTKEIVATNGRFDRLCVGSTCVTEEQFMAMVAAAGQTAGIPSASAPAGTPQAPIIELNGNASSTIELGDTYNDLGARIIAPESDLNLGIVVLLDGATTTEVSIDTSAPGDHTILYTVTSPTTGLTGTTMRTVSVSPAAQLSEPPANDNPFNAPANDNASSTAAVDAAA